MEKALDFGRLTLGTATYDDFDGLFFTLTALRLYHPEVFDKAEIVVVDNNPTGIDGQANIQFLQSLTRDRDSSSFNYVPLMQPKGTGPARQKIFEVATRDIVVVFDSHILFVPDAFRKLLEYFEENPECRDIVSGPVLSESGKVIATHFVHQWRGQMLGTWGLNPKGLDPDGPAFEIAGCGLGVFACRREIWPGFHPAFRGFGAEELYIHEKFRRLGGRAICLPGFRWVHRFGRPRGVPYPLTIWHKVRNYIIAFQELGWDVQNVKDYFVGAGFMPEEHWNILIQDPYKNENPPQIVTLDVAEDAPERSAVMNYANQIPPAFRNRTPSDIEHLKPPANSILQQLPEHLPEQVKQAILNQPPERQAEILQRYQQIRAGQTPIPIGGCSGCGSKAAAQRLEVRKEYLDKIKDVKSFDELLAREDLPSNYKEYRDFLIQKAKESKFIVEVSDDPFGTTLPLLSSMPSDGLLVSYYLDPKYANELNFIGKLAHDSGRKAKLTIIPIEALSFEPDVEFDLFVFDPLFPDAETVSKVLTTILPKISKRAIILKTDKYGAWTADKKPGIMPALTAFLVQPENSAWSVIKYERSGLGMTYLSKVKADKPKLPSTFTLASNFIKAIADHIKTGAQEVDKDELEWRLKRCSICEHRVDNRCSVCGCFITSDVPSHGKAYWKEQKCPLNYWAEYKKNDEE